MSDSTEQQARESERRAEEDVDERVRYLCEAAEYWHAAGADDRARELFERALTEHGHAPGDERVAYARFLLDVGDTGHAHQLLDEVWHSRDLDGLTYSSAGRLDEFDLDDPATAMRWYTSGIVRLAGPDAAGGARDDIWIELLMRARREVRGKLGEPADEWDRLWDAAGQPAGDDTDAATSHGTGVTAFPYWTPDELAEYLRRWPEGYPGFRDAADPHAEHRREVESALRRFPAAAVVVKPTVAGFAEYAESENLAPADSSARASYAAAVAQQAHTTPWPPGRNDPCWCGSARKYKKCCGAPGFVEQP